MAEFEFILDDEEQRQLIEFLLDTNAVLVPSLWYQQPVYQVLNSPGDVMKVIGSPWLIGPIYVLSEEISLYPLEFTKIEKDEGTFFFLKDRHGGPYMDFIPSGTRQVKGIQSLRSGSVGYYPTYRISQSGLDVEAPEQLKLIYRDTTRFLRSICRKQVTKKANRVYWVGVKALEKLRDGMPTNVAGLNLTKS